MLSLMNCSILAQSTSRVSFHDSLLPVRTTSPVSRLATLILPQTNIRHCSTDPSSRRGLPVDRNSSSSGTRLDSAA
jgi:hypothetical protein